MSDRDEGMLFVSSVLALTPSITHPERCEACVAAVHASCVQVYACVINLFAYISKSVYALVCIVGINIPSVSLSALIYTMCLCVKCVHVCMPSVCVYYETTSSCPSGAAMLCRSASSLIAPISLWFAASYTHTYRVMYTLAHECAHTHAHTHTYTLDTNLHTHACLAVILFPRERGRKMTIYLL